MAGGTWLSQNKVRPGAYINFEGVPKSGMTVGDRGIVALGLPLKWGEEGKFIEVLSMDLLDGTSKKLVGFTAFDELDASGKLLVAALSYCYKALVYRMNSGGEKASLTTGGLQVTARCTGTMGNKINIMVSEVDGKEDDEGNPEKFYEVTTFFDGEQVDRQKVHEIGELADNPYVEFSKTGDGEFEEDAGSPLVGGTDGEQDDSKVYPKMLNQLELARFQTFACFSSEVSVKQRICDFIQQMRDDEGRYVQAVVADHDAADHEGIVNNVCGAVINGEEFSKEEFVAIVAGMCAGANFNQSNTARVVTGATRIIGELNDTEIKEGLGKGKFILSMSTGGNVIVEKDINSLHTFTKKRGYAFSKNRVIRTLDEIGTTTKQTWEDTYTGKVDNNETGRGLFKADLVAYGNELQRLSGIQEFDGTRDISISQGDDLDSVVAEWAVKPVDSMEILYLTCKVSG